MINQFFSQMGDSGKMDPEELCKKMKEMGQQWKDNCGQKWNFEGKHSWKENRAICQRKPEEVLEIYPGQTRLVEIEVLNDTHWPWKAGCMLGLADEQADPVLPIEVFNLPVDNELKGKSSATFQLPLTMASHVVADPEKVYEVRFAFRGPKGQTFGTMITLKIKCLLAPSTAGFDMFAASTETTPQTQPQNTVSDIDVYKLAIKLHEQLTLGSLDDCIKAARENNCDEASSISALQRKN